MSIYNWNFFYICYVASGCSPYTGGNDRCMEEAMYGKMKTIATNVINKQASQQFYIKL